MRESISKQAWLVWGLAATFSFYQFMLQSTTSVFGEQLAIDFQLTSLGVGTIAAAYFYTYVILQLPIGVLMDKFGPRRLFLLGVPATVLSCVLFALSPNDDVAFIARLLMGLSTTPGLIGALYLAARWFPGRYLAIIIGLTETICMMGGGLGQQFLAWLLILMDWRSAMLLISAIGAVLAVLCWRYIQDAPPSEDIETISPVDRIPEQQKPSIWRNLKEVVGNRSIVSVGLFSGMLSATLPAFAGLWALHFLRTTYDVSLQVATLGGALLYVGAALGSPLAGWWSDLIGQRKPLMLAGSLSSLLLIWLILYYPSLSLSRELVFLFLLGLTISPYILAFSLAQESTPMDCQGTAMGFINMCALMIGAPILQPIIGSLLEYSSTDTGYGLAAYQASDYQFALLVLPITMVISLIGIVFTRETYCRSLQQRETLQRTRTQDSQASSNWVRRRRRGTWF